MKHTLNHLIQLQELNFALAEQQASQPGARLKQLEEAIDKLRSKLPEDLATRYLKLQQRSQLVVVPIVRNNNCAGCGVAVATGLANEIRAAEQIHFCPNCGRFLYHAEGMPRRPDRPPGQRPQQTGIARFSDRALMLPELKAKTRDETITELAELMAANGFIDDAATLADLALRRETMVSTAVERGIAFPHVRNVDTGSLTLALGLHPKGVKFDAPDGELTRIVFFMVIPTAASAFYLRLLAGLVKTFSTAKARNTLLKSDTPDKMWTNLVALTRETVP
ncbi:MAG: PTS sugar transporter subunit IIA [Verrucomicrobiae bacterium]|nr:PTS sugar transporter subunit IIA [Verrucomicrobiae bacterium]